MELHRLDRQLAVPDPHDHARVGPRVHPELGRDRLGLDGQRVVAGRGQRARQAGEHAGPVVDDRTRLAVQQFGSAGDRRAVRDTHRLESEADTEDRDDARELLDQLDADAGSLGGAGAWREQDAVVAACLVEIDHVVASHVHLGTELPEVLHQVVDERVDVVDDENAAHGFSMTATATAADPARWHRSADSERQVDDHRRVVGCPLALAGLTVDVGVGHGLGERVGCRTRGRYASRCSSGTRAAGSPSRCRRRRT